MIYYNNKKIVRAFYGVKNVHNISSQHIRNYGSEVMTFNIYKCVDNVVLETSTVNIEAGQTYTFNDKNLLPLNTTYKLEFTNTGGISYKTYILNDEEKYFKLSPYINPLIAVPLYANTNKPLDWDNEIPESYYSLDFEVNISGMTFNESRQLRYRIYDVDDVNNKVRLINTITQTSNTIDKSIKLTKSFSTNCLQIVVDYYDELYNAYSNIINYFHYRIGNTNIANKLNLIYSNETYEFIPSDELTDEFVSYPPSTDPDVPTDEPTNPPTDEPVIPIEKQYQMYFTTGYTMDGRVIGLCTNKDGEKIVDITATQINGGYEYHNTNEIPLEETTEFKIYKNAVRGSFFKLNLPSNNINKLYIGTNLTSTDNTNYILLKTIDLSNFNDSKLTYCDVLVSSSCPNLEKIICSTHLREVMKTNTNWRFAKFQNGTVGPVGSGCNWELTDYTES